MKCLPELAGCNLRKPQVRNRRPPKAALSETASSPRGCGPPAQCPHRVLPPSRRTRAQRLPRRRNTRCRLASQQLPSREPGTRTRPFPARGSRRSPNKLRPFNKPHSAFREGPRETLFNRNRAPPPAPRQPCSPRAPGVTEEHTMSPGTPTPGAPGLGGPPAQEGPRRRAQVGYRRAQVAAGQAEAGGSVSPPRTQGDGASPGGGGPGGALGSGAALGGAARGWGPPAARRGHRHPPHLPGPPP